MCLRDGQPGGEGGLAGVLVDFAHGLSGGLQTIFCIVPRRRNGQKYSYISLLVSHVTVRPIPERP